MSSQRDSTSAMELSSSDEEDCQPEYWNNWLPTESQKFDRVKYKSNRVRFTKATESHSNFSEFLSVCEDAKFGSWIPPLSFFNSVPTVKDVQNPVPKTNPKQFQKNKPTKNNENLNPIVNKEVTKIPEVTIISGDTPTSTTPWRKEVNLDWGERVQLHDVTKFNNGDLFWGVVNLSVFGNIKLWVNEYGNICCLASGKITKQGSSEMTFISITEAELLRKMLSISADQWASLCETVKETKAVLKFDAFEEFDVGKRTSLERLWFFICKRRHFLPRQCMLVNFNGAVKCLRKLEINPKLVVKDIRSMEDVKYIKNMG